MADLRRHPDVVDLAEYAEGVLDASRQAAVEEHVRDCADCTATLADLAGLSETLAETPVPPLPTDVADRLDRVMAAEASARASATTDKPSSTVVPIRERRRWLRPVLVAAAVIGVIGIAVPALDNGPDSSSESSAGSAADESGQRAEMGGSAGNQARSGNDLAPGDAQEGRVPALSSANFGRDVADRFYPDDHQSMQPGPSSAKPLDEIQTTRGKGLCPAAANAELPQGRVVAITLDGRPAYLLLQPGATIDAVAFTCQGAEPQLLASANLKAP